MSGVNEWERKRRAIELLCGDGTRQETVAKIWGAKDFPANILDSYGKFGEFLPKKEEFRTFFQRLAVFLGCKSGITDTDMITCSYDEFVRYMSPQKRATLRRLEGTREHVHFLVDLEANRADVHTEWLRSEIVDQRYMYQDREAVDGWNAVVRSGTYHQYENCKRVLDEFLLSEAWRNLVLSGQLGSVVILGAGASEKDIQILNSILNSGSYNKENTFKFAIFDSSFHMLSDTIAALEDVLKRKAGGHDAVDLLPCCADFLRLRAWRDQIRPARENKKVAIFILGGTIGNIDEGALFEAVRHVTEDDDLFVVSGEFLPDDDIEGYLAELEEYYNQPETKDFALSAVRSLLDQEHPRDAPTRRSYVEVTVEREAMQLPNRIRSFIPGTVAAVFRLNVPIEGAYLTLVVSKRYQDKALISAVKGFHCVEVHCIEKYSKLYKHSELHKYLVFQRQSY